MPPGSSEFTGSQLGLDMSDGDSRSGKRLSKIMALPLPPGSNDLNDLDEMQQEEGDGTAKQTKHKPKVIGKVNHDIRMSKDGMEWGEKCIDIYHIVHLVGQGMY